MIIKDTLNKGKGLFSEDFYQKEQVILKFKGIVVPRQDLYKYPDISDRFLQVSLDNFLNIEKDISVFINHDCNPNTYIKVVSNNAFLVSCREIYPGEEIVYDYSLTSTDTHSSWSMACSCSLFSCRKVISGFGTVDPDKRNKLILSGMVPKYIADYYSGH